MSFGAQTTNLDSDPGGSAGSAPESPGPLPTGISGDSDVVHDTDMQGEEDWFNGVEPDSNNQSQQQADGEDKPDEGGEVQEGEASAEGEGQDGNLEPETETQQLRRMVEMQQAQINQFMQQQQEEPVDVEKLQQLINTPYQFSLPEDIANSEAFSDKLKHYASTEGDLVSVIGEMINHAIQGVGDYEKQVTDARTTLGAHQERLIQARDQQLKSVGIDPAFIESEQFQNALQSDQALLARAQSYVQVYGQGSAHAISNMWQDFRNYCSQKNIDIADLARQNFANKSKQSQGSRTPQNPPKPPNTQKPKGGKQEADADWFAGFDAIDHL